MAHAPCRTAGAISLSENGTQGAQRLSQALGFFWMLQTAQRIGSDRLWLHGSLQQLGHELFTSHDIHQTNAWYP
jgi:hypothetical protein